MLPGFAKIIHHASASVPLIQHAGLWDSPNECRFIGTKTFCTGVVLWCQNNFICPGPNEFQSSAPYPCGVCVGITDPSDW